VYKIDEYIPDFLFESFDMARETLAEWLVKLGIFGKVAKLATGGGGNDAPREYELCLIVVALEEVITDVQIRLRLGRDTRTR
jgi:protein kinase C substrate 80K-H